MIGQTRLCQASADQVVATAVTVAGTCKTARSDSHPRDISSRETATSSLFNLCLTRVCHCVPMDPGCLGFTGTGGDPGQKTVPVGNIRCQQLQKARLHSHLSPVVYRLSRGISKRCHGLWTVSAGSTETRSALNGICSYSVQGGLRSNRKNQIISAKSLSLN